MSVERRSIIVAYGAELILTEGKKGMNGAIEKAGELIENNPDFFMPQQFKNSANPLKHYETTGEEIIKDLPDLDAFVAGVGTGGTISGAGKRLKEFNSEIKIVAVEPQESPVISGGKPGPHKIQGIGAGFVPDNLDLSVVDEIIEIPTERAFEICRILAENGLLLGASSGANIAAAYETAKKLIDRYYFGIGGVVTFKNNKVTKETVEKLPIERIVIETDCPYLTPVPFRGKRNEPIYVKYIAEEIAKIKGISLEEVIKITTKNAREIYKISI